MTSPGDVPTFVKVGAGVMALLVGTLVAAGAWLAYDQHQEARLLCERTVTVRDDNRAMWVWLIDAVAGSSPLAPEARVQLDLRIPALHCVDNRPEPIGSSEGD